MSFAGFGVDWSGLERLSILWVTLSGFAVLDEVDRKIVQMIREAGIPGVLPKVVAADVNLRGNFELRYYDMSLADFAHE